MAARHLHKKDETKMSEHAGREHSRYGASSAHRYFRCPGSVALCTSVPEQTSIYALEGTQAHELLEATFLAEHILLDTTRAPYFVQNAKEKVTAAPEGMLDAVKIAIDFIENILDSYPDAQIIVEQKFGIVSQAAPGQVFGTCDFIVYVPSMRLLYVIDYKHGAGVIVDVIDNEQLQFYALGALMTYSHWRVDTVAMVIIQPRAPNFSYPIPEWWVEAEHIRTTFAAELELRIRATQEPVAALVPGEKQCRFCAAVTICPARERLALAAVHVDFASVRQVTAESLPPVEALAPERITEILNKAEMLEKWLDAVRKHATSLLHEGKVVPGYKLVEAQARRKWNGLTEGIALWEHADSIPNKLVDIASLFGVSLSVHDFAPPQLVDITKVEEILHSLAREKTPRGKKNQSVSEVTNAMAFLTIKKSSGQLKLAPIEDPRPAFDLVKSSFSSVVNLPYVEVEE